MKPKSNEKKQEPSIKCLVIQMAGLTDVFQSLMALRAAKQLYPNLEVTYVVKEQHIAPLERIPWIENVISLPVSEFTLPLKSNPVVTEDQVKKFAHWMKANLIDSYDLLINWSYTEASSYLSTIIPAACKLGYIQSDDLKLICADEWSHFVDGVIKRGLDQNIHLTDVLTTQLLTELQVSFSDPKNVQNESVTSKSFFNLNINRDQYRRLQLDLGRTRVVFYLSSDSERFMWKPKDWANLAVDLLKKHSDTQIILLGESDAESIEIEILKQLERNNLSSRCISVVGLADFDLYVASVSQSHWVISAHLPTVHLASVLGTRVIQLADINSDWVERGPYGNSHYIVVPKPQAPKLDPFLVRALWSYASTDFKRARIVNLRTHFQESGIDNVAEEALIYRSKIRSPEEGGGVVYESILAEHYSLRDWIKLVSGQVARSWYCGWMAPVGQEISRKNIHPQLLNELRNAKTILEQMILRTEELVVIATRIYDKGKNLRSDKVMSLSDQSALQDIYHELQSVELKFDELSNRSVALKLFSNMRKILMHNLKGKTLQEQSKHAVLQYKKLNRGMKVYLSWLDHTLGLSRPMIVTKENVIQIKGEL